jgi:hypothetical protein
MLELHFKTIIISTVFLVLWIMFFTLHRNFHIARTRQRLFGIRASLFNAALEGKIGFDEPAYRQVRQVLNGIIRFTHNLSFFRMLAIVIFNQYVHKDLLGHFNSQLEKALDKLTLEQKELLLNSLDEAHLQIVRHLMSVSLLWPIFKLLSVIFKIADMTKGARKWATNGLNRTQQWRRFDAEVTYSSSCEDDDCGLMLAA